MDKKARAQTRLALFLRLAGEAEAFRDEPNPGHYKHGRLNYYPSTGTYTWDRGGSGKCEPPTAIELAREEDAEAGAPETILVRESGLIDF